jgi:hypothetical protein
VRNPEAEKRGRAIVEQMPKPYIWPRSTDYCLLFTIEKVNARFQLHKCQVFPLSLFPLALEAGAEVLARACSGQAHGLTCGELGSGDLQDSRNHSHPRHDAGSPRSHLSPSSFRYDLRQWVTDEARLESHQPQRKISCSCCYSTAKKAQHSSPSGGSHILLPQYLSQTASGKFFPCFIYIFRSISLVFSISSICRLIS